MTDLLDGDPIEAEAGYIPPTSNPFACDQPGCEFVGENATRLGYHRWRAHGIRSENSRPKKPKPRADRAPGSVTINMPSARATGKDKELAAVEERARMLVQTMAAVIAMTAPGNPTLQADAADLNRGAQPIASALRNVAQYEEWLRKLAAGGQSPDRIMAWVTLAMTVGTVAMPMLLRHGVLPANLAEQAEAMFVQAAGADDQAA